MKRQIHKSSHSSSPTPINSVSPSSSNPTPQSELSAASTVKPLDQNNAKETMAKTHKIAKSLKSQNKYKTFQLSTAALAVLPVDQKIYLLEELKFLDPAVVDSLNIYKVLTSDSHQNFPNNFSHNDTLDLLNVMLKPATFSYYAKLFTVFQEGKGYALFNDKIYDSCVRKEVSNFQNTMRDIIAKVSNEIESQRKKTPVDEEVLDELEQLYSFYLTKGSLIDSSDNVLEKRPPNTKYPISRLNKLQPAFVPLLETMNLRVEAYTCKLNKTLKRILREHPGDEVLEKIINRRLVEEFGFDGCFDSVIVEQIRASEEQTEASTSASTSTSTSSIGKKAKALDKTKVKDLHPVIFKPSYDYRLQIPALKDFVPDSDSTIYDIEFLKNLTDLKLKQLQAYLNEVNLTRKKHPHLHNDASFIGLTECLRMGTSLMDTFISIDIEAFEFSQQKITEIGISIYDPLKEALSFVPNFTNIHILIKEHLHLRNGKYVVDNKDRYLCGNSIILTKNEALKFIQSLLDHYLISRYETHGMNSILVGHDIKGDIKWLKQLGLHLPANVKSLDTQIISRLSNGSNQLGLGKILNRYGIPHSYLHNAGNDAYFTLLLLLKLVDVGFRKTQKIDVPVKNFESIEDVKQVVLPDSSASIRKMKKPHKIFEFSEAKGFFNYGDALKGVYRQD